MNHLLRPPLAPCTNALDQSCATAGSGADIQTMRDVGYTKVNEEAVKAAAEGDAGED